MKPSISTFDGEALADFIDPFLEGIEASVNASVVKIEYIGRGQKSENPVVGFHIGQHQLKRVTHINHNVPQNVHRITLL